MLGTLRSPGCSNLQFSGEMINPRFSYRPQGKKSTSVPTKAFLPKLANRHCASGILRVKSTAAEVETLSDYSQISKRSKM